MQSFEQSTVNEQKPRLSLDNIEKSLSEIQDTLEKFGLTESQIRQDCEKIYRTFLI